MELNPHNSKRAKPPFGGLRALLRGWVLARGASLFQPDGLSLDFPLSPKAGETCERTTHVHQ